MAEKDSGITGQPGTHRVLSGGNEQRPQHPRTPPSLATVGPRERELFMQMFTFPNGSSPALDKMLDSRPVNAPQDRQRAPEPETRRRPSPLPYDEAVAEARGFIRKQTLLAGEQSLSPQAIIQDRLAHLALTEVSGPEKARAWNRIGLACDVLTHHTYEPGSKWERRAGYRAQTMHNRYDPLMLPHDETLLVGALLDAAGVPHEGGISVIHIPQHLKHYDEWTRSDEYRARVLDPSPKHT